MQVREVMTVAVECCTPNDTARQAAEFMREADSGAIPVLASSDDPRVIGILTDRDLCMDVVAAGRDPNQTRVSECMTPQVVTCGPGDNLTDVAALMAEQQIRRIPVVDTDGSIMGIVSLADLAQRQSDTSEAGEALQDITDKTSGPSVPRMTRRH